MDSDTTATLDAIRNMIEAVPPFRPTIVALHDWVPGAYVPVHDDSGWPHDIVLVPRRVIDRIPRVKYTPRWRTGRIIGPEIWGIPIEDWS